MSMTAFLVGCNKLLGRRDDGINRQTVTVDLQSTFIAIYVNPWPLGTEEWHWTPRVIAAVWSDGKAIWSRDWIHGGPPYLAGQIDEQALKGFATRIREAGLLGAKETRQTYAVFESNFTVIRVCEPGRSFTMQSVHEIISNPNLVATAYGVEALEGRSGEDVLSEQPAEYQLFRRTWDLVKTGTVEMLPASGTECENVKFTY